MLTYTLNKSSSDPLYLSLYKCIRNDIRSGVLKGGARLPSKRTFAINLGVSVITVESAYERLIAEGYVFSMPKRGFYVADLKLLSGKGHLPSPVLLPSGNDRVFADFRSNETDLDSFPFKIWARLSRRVFNEHRREILSNPPSGGMKVLREAIAATLKAFHGMQVDPRQIVVGAGTEYLMGLLIQLLGFDRIYAAEDPGYARIYEIYKSFGVKCAGVKLDAEGLSVSTLEKTCASVVHISPSHQFPSGVVMPISRRYELLGWAMRSDDRYIIEDDYDSEFRLSGRPLAPLQNIDAEGRVIYMNTFTKTLASTVRVSYMVLPQALCERFYRLLSFYSCTVSTFEQYTLALFINEGIFEQHLNRMRILYAQKRARLVELLHQSTLAGRFEMYGEQLGLHFLLKIDTKYSDPELSALFLEKGLRISMLSEYFRAREQAPMHVLVLNYSSVKLEDLKQAVDILEEVLA